MGQGNSRRRFQLLLPWGARQRARGGATALWGHRCRGGRSSLAGSRTSFIGPIRPAFGEAVDGSSRPYPAIARPRLAPRPGGRSASHPSPLRACVKQETADRGRAHRSPQQAPRTVEHAARLGPGPPVARCPSCAVPLRCGTSCIWLIVPAHRAEPWGVHPKNCPLPGIAGDWGVRRTGAPRPPRLWRPPLRLCLPAPRARPRLWGDFWCCSSSVPPPLVSGAVQAHGPARVCP